MRTIHKFIAWVGGYFWLPCAVCGKMFGGHQLGDSPSFIKGKDGIFKVVCPSPHCNYMAGVSNTKTEPGWSLTKKGKHEILRRMNTIKHGDQP